MHLIPPAVVEAARAGRFGLSIEQQRMRVGRSRAPLGKINDVTALIARLDADRLVGGFVALPPLLFRADQPGAQRRAWAEFVNESLAAVIADHPGRLHGLAFLPAEDPVLAVSLLDALSDDWAGVTFGTELNGGRFHRPEYDRLWGALAQRRLPVLLHPGHPPDERLDEFYLTNLLGYPMETTLAAAHLVFGGVLERHPKLDVVLSHGGAAVATLVGRWQLGVDTQRPGVPSLRRDIIDLVRRFHVDTVVHSPAYVDFLIAVLGPERLVLGSDWPFPMGTGAAEEGLEHVAPQNLRSIREANVRELFGASLAT